MRALDQLRRGFRQVTPLSALVLFAVLGGCGPSDDAAGHEEHSEAGEHDENVGSEHSNDVALTTEMLRNAGIQTTQAGPGTVRVTLRLTATVVDNLDAQVHINPKVGGVIHAVHSKLGDTVAKSDALCEIDSVEYGNAVADYLKARAAARAAESTLGKSRQLFVRRQETLKRVLDGAVEVASAIFERETDLKNRELTTLRPYLEAEKALKESVFARDRDMTNLEADRDQRLLELSVDLRAAQVELQSAENRLHILGMDHAQIVRLEDEQGTLLGRYVLRAPSAGIVTQREATLNEFVDTDAVLFQIDNLERSWIIASVFEKDLATVRTGQSATVRLSAFPGVAFEGRVTYVSHSIDPATRAAPVRIELDNTPIPQWKELFPIRPGMFGVIELAIETVEVSLGVPTDALLRDEDTEYVFVREDELNFERREVKLGARSGTTVEVLEGLEAGDQVVTAGTFELKSQLQKGKLGGGHEH